MSFNIHQLDRIDSCDEKADKALEKFQNEILEKFYRSLNEEAITDMDHEIGFWSAQLINYGFNYIWVTLPNMAVSDIEEIVTELFPKKITIDTPEEANITIPELKLFWQFLKREFNLKNSDLILKYLSDIEPNYNKIMNDPSRFGMAKSFVMSGKSAGFNMKNDSDFYKYALLVEVDGFYHGLPKGKRKDYFKNKYLTKMGYEVLRFSGDEIDEDLDGCIDKIFTYF